MPAAIPDRYKLEMRLGRDGDLEEWLATDASLERPVLVRSLGPETTAQRREQFEVAVMAAAKVSHPHLAKVFSVEIVDGGAYSVSEWTGGATLEDRIAAGHVMEVEEFLPNAAGLAGALAALHETGTSHGSIDLSAISYSAAHPAKLGAFGRPHLTNIDGDVSSLASVLETAITGNPPGGPPPSESIDGFPRAIDRILRTGQSGGYTAHDLREALLAAPTPRTPRPESRALSGRLLVMAAALVIVAVGLVALGRLFVAGGPVIPDQPDTTSAGRVTTEPPTVTTLAGTVALTEVSSYDPFGEGGENDDLLANLTDGNPSTNWRTERYQDPMALVKPGVGVRFDVSGSPGSMEMRGLTPETSFEVYWGEAVFPLVDEWERILGGIAPEGTTSLRLPARPDGHWLLWLTDVPQQPDGTYSASLSEVLFQP